MKFIQQLPFYSFMDGDVLEVGLWESSENICEHQNLEENTCLAGAYYGTTDEMEPKFCARHFFQDVVSGDGKSNYKLISTEEAQKYL
jgi:hypothetical protein